MIWLEVLKALAPVVTAIIAFVALNNWQRQDKAKRQAEFLDTLIETIHAYITELSQPITQLEFAKMAIKSHAPTWESGSEADKTVKGAIAYIEKYGEAHSKQMLDALTIAQAPANKLKSLAVKGQVFQFQNYEKCQSAAEALASQFDRIQGFAALIGLGSATNWENPQIRSALGKVVSIDPKDIQKTIQESEVVLIDFTTEAYRRIYR